MLDAALRVQLKGYLDRLTQPVGIQASLDESGASREMLELLEDIVSASPRVTLKAAPGGDADIAPSFALHAGGAAPRVRFAGLPLGHEFT
ncbi:MAG TPA: hypothetical protein VHY75_15300 [Steroidobacteraceae bacterium]|nr:hypothetical protein [Steroidobacteraceae bacterium]